MKRWTSRQIWEVVEVAGYPPEDFPSLEFDKAEGQYFPNDDFEWVPAREALATIARYKAALEAIVAVDAPKVDEGEVMAEIAQEALNA